jgi:hypothetical protein
MRRWAAFIFAIVIFFLLHEGAHAMMAALFGEFQAFHIRPIGFEVTFNTPVEARSGIRWTLISGTSNLLTILLGYALLAGSRRIARLQNMLLKGSLYYLTLVSLLVDPFNLSIGPFFYGGDAIGMAVGLGINRLAIQAVFFCLLLVNREIIARRLLPAYGTQTDHPLLRPWLPQSR